MEPHTLRRFLLAAIVLAVMLLIMAAQGHAQKLPDHFMVGKERWTLTYDAGICAEQLNGLTGDDEEKTVWLCPDLPPRAIRETLVHELLHVAINSTTAEFICKRKYDEHEWIYRAQFRLSQILLDNPELTAFLAERKPHGTTRR